MKIFNIFRKKKKIRDELIEKKIHFEEIRKFIREEEDLLKKKEEEFFEEIDNKIKFFKKNLCECLLILKNVDVKSRKIEERAKILVKQGLDKYLESVNFLEKEILDLQKENIQKFILDFNKIFSEFEKKSFNSYQRATYTIGKEISNVNNCIVGFFKEIENDFKENNQLIGKKDTIIEIYSQLINFENKQKDLERLRIEEEGFDKKLKEIKSKENSLIEEKKYIEKNKEYLDNKELVKKKNSLEKEIQRKIAELNYSIDWKKIANIFHSNEKEMNKIKEIRENFRERFLEEDLIKILKRAEILKKEFEERRVEIEKNLGELRILYDNIKPDSIDNLNMEINSIKSRKINLEEEGLKLKKRRENMEFELKNLKERIAKRTTEIGDCKLILN